MTIPHSIRSALAGLLAARSLAPTPSSLQAQAAPPSPARLSTSLDSVVRTDVLGRGVTGVSVVVARGTGTLVERSWGFADVAAQRPADAWTTYRLGSMSKQFTAVLLLKQVDRGRLSLDDTIGRYLTGLKPEWTGRTIAQLLNHTAGVPRDFREASRVAEELPTDSLIAMAARSPAPTAPAGTAFIYSNTGYLLLGALVEQRYGASYGTALRDEIARPLGLATLGWCGDTEAAGGGAKGYHRAPGGAVGPAPYTHPSQALGSGGVCSSAGDVARWNRALHGGKVLSAASYAAMTTPRGAAARRGSPYGFGLYIRPTPGGGTVLLHDGTTPGYAGENVWYPAESLSVTMLTNTSPSLGADLNLTEAIGRIALGRPPAPNPVPMAPTVALAGTPATATVGVDARRQFVGDYEMAPGIVFAVTSEDGSFYVTPPRGARQLLVHESGVTYAVGRTGSTTTFLVDTSGRVIGMVTRQHGAERRLRKVQ